ncbi:MAG: 3-deoxy-D-manno-octulosonic acid transferase [Cytophagaceae bacterium]|jgi:3-deoxy-D-manno-octulosonic-acid transferase|nr:3-deoxy-D-manno-octulosonic acid transferase [Cytophagaceae bacterium]
MKVIYNIGLWVWECILSIGATFGKTKARQIIQGRKYTLSLPINRNNSSKRLWFHCASLGEFEQARPLIEALKKRQPSIEILLTFYSPSGYEYRKNYALATHIAYLPADYSSIMQDWVNKVEPDIVFFVKYEFWPNLLQVLQDNSIPTYLLSGVFRKDQLFFKWYGQFFKKKLNSFEYFFLQDYKSQELLHSLGYTNSNVTGDTRFDRVLENKKNILSIPLIDNFVSTATSVLVVGSCWPEDVSILLPFIKQLPTGVKCILVPHDIGSNSILRLKRQIYPLSAAQYSELTDDSTLHETSILIVDTMGMLSTLYHYATIVHVGGAFGKGLHNILEPAVFGVPIVFGPNIKKFQEAQWMISLGCAFSVESAKEWEMKVRALLQQPETRASIKIRLQNAIEVASGATNKIMKQLEDSYPDLFI